LYVRGAWRLRTVSRDHARAAPPPTLLLSLATRTCATAVLEKRGGRACPAKAVAALLSEAGLERWQADDIPTTALDEDEIEDVVNLWGLVFAEIEEAGGPAINFEASEGLAFKIWLKRSVDAGGRCAGWRTVVCERDQRKSSVLKRVTRVDAVVPEARADAREGDRRPRKRSRGRAAAMRHGRAAGMRLRGWAALGALGVRIATSFPGRPPPLPESQRMVRYTDA
jgi:hypothetical protein